MTITKIWNDSSPSALASKINELIDKVEELEKLIQTKPPQRYFKNDYGYVYEVDEFGNPIIPQGPPRM